MGFECLEGANVADFLTAVTATNERKIRDDHEGKVPTAPAEFAELYAGSEVARRMNAELEEYLGNEAAREEETKIMREAVDVQKHRYTPKNRPERINYFGQVQAALVRDYKQRWGDQW